MLFRLKHEYLVIFYDMYFHRPFFRGNDEHQIICYISLFKTKEDDFMAFKRT